MKQKNYKVIVFIILVIGLLARIHVTDFSRPIPDYSDGTVYHYAALNLQKYGILTYDRDGSMYRGETSVVPTSGLMPGMPLFLLALYCINSSTAFIYIVQILLSMIVLLLILKIMQRLNISNLIQLVVLALAAVYPASCYNLDFVLTETCFTTCFTAFIYFFIRFIQAANNKILPPAIKDLVYANCLLMCATMFRAQALPFVVVECFFLIVYFKEHIPMRNRLGYSLVVAGVVLLFMVPLWIRNWVTFGQFWLLTEAGESPKLWGAQPYFLNRSSTAHLSADEMIRYNLSITGNSYWIWRLFGFFNFMWYDMWDENLVHPFEVLKLFRMIHPLIIVPTVAMIPLLINRAKPETLLVACVPIVFSLMCMPFHGLPRYVFPSIPCVFILLALLLDTLGLKISKKDCTNIEPFSWKWQIFIDRVFRFCYFTFGAIFSLILIYSVYFFDDNVRTEMSDYMLNHIYNVSISEVEQMDIVEDQELITNTSCWWVDNATYVDGIFKGEWDTYPLLNVSVPETENTTGDEKLITKVELNLPGGYFYDYCTIYWTGDSLSEYSEEYVYGRFPRSSRDNIITVYIPDDVSEMMIVPCGFRGAEFSIESIHISKYIVSDK